MREHRFARRTVSSSKYRKIGRGRSVDPAGIGCYLGVASNLEEILERRGACLLSRGPFAMPRSSIFTTLILTVLAMASQVRAEHAKINLDVASGGNNVSAFVDQTPPEWGKNPRPVIKAKVNEPIRINYLLTNVYPHKTLENVVVHFFIAPEEGWPEGASRLKGDVVMESAFDMDFKPGGKAGQRSTIKIDEPGVYLIRIETRNTQSDHEHFAAIDLVVGEESKP